ncbi:3-deoxy-D-manno-octulosonic acid transferase [Candidatus Omnitrophota bacterium]
MFIFYDLIYLIFIIFYLSVSLLKGKRYPGIKLRLGILPKGVLLDGPVWIHAVSVGEAMAVRQLLEALRKVYPKKNFVISTVTPTGNKIAKTLAGPQDFVTYLPMDLGFIVHKVISRVRPSLFIIVETEVWPNLISCLHRKKIPIAVVNGRISDSSFKGYSRIKLLIRMVLRKVDLFCVQTERDKDRLISLGVDRGNIQATGNMKFDNLIFDEEKVTGSVDKYRHLLGITKDEKLLLAGSTHPGEEEIILNTYKNLLGDFPDLRLLIAPRHPERSAQIAGLIEKYGFEPERISLLEDESETRLGKKMVFVLDTIGQLIYFYALADIVFVGGSLTKKGGQNILEPTSLGKPVICGPHMFNFRDIADLFISKDAILLARDQEELSLRISSLLKDPSLVSALAGKAKAIISKNRGATAKNLDFITKSITI